MISLLTLCAALALTQADRGYASPAPVPTPGHLTTRDMRPRYLREASSLPERGIFEDGVITVPLRRRAPAPFNKAKRQNIVQVPVADNQDFSYGVAVDIGGQTVTFQVDTGSADLWSMTSNCQTPSGGKCTNSTGIPAYTPSSTFQSLNTPLQINYGSSAEPTFASGTIGVDNVTFGGLEQPQQVFASMDHTNNSITNSYSGIFGVGFPYISEMVTTIIDATLSASTGQFTGQSLLNTYFTVMQESAPLLTHLADAGKLKAPMYTLSLQREDPTSVGSNAGVMTIGGLPSGISNDSLTWVPVKQYPITVSLFGGLSTAIDPTLVSEAEKILPTTPYVWEAVIDGLYVNGNLQKDSSGSEGGLSALFDSGTTETLITASDAQSPDFPSIDSTTGTLPCNTVINMAFGIGGKQFAINPFDLITPYDENDSKVCAVGIGLADPPSASGTFSYIIGDAFFRSNLIAFYWGNLTDQGSDPARMGFLSTTNAAEADATYSSFWQSVGTKFAFPTATSAPKLATTSIANPVGAGASSGGSSSGGSGSTHSGAAQLSYIGWRGAAVVAVLFGAVMI